MHCFVAVIIHLPNVRLYFHYRYNITPLLLNQYGVPKCLLLLSLEELKDGRLFAAWLKDTFSKTVAKPDIGWSRFSKYSIKLNDSNSFSVLQRQVFQKLKYSEPLDHPAPLKYTLKLAIPCCQLFEHPFFWIGSFLGPHCYIYISLYGVPKLQKTKIFVEFDCFTGIQKIFSNTQQTF